MDQKPSEGIFYVVLMPDGWRLMPLPFGQDEDVGHTEWWEGSLGRTLAEEWAKKLRTNPQTLAEQITMLPYAFPRGRVTKVGRAFRIHHGSDLTTTMGVSRSMIEDAFGVGGRCSWRFDDHEQCQAEDQGELRRCLGIDEKWPAI